jgi:hypothetical protein
MPLFLDSYSSQSSMVFGNGFPAVSGSINDRAADSKALEPNRTVGMLMLISAKVPTRLARTPPMRATREQDPRPAFLRQMKCKN